MKDYLKQIIEDRPGILLKTCLVREYLQARVLESLQESGAFLSWAFLGGTALRFLYSIPRFSEDLVFSLRDPARAPDFRQTLRKVQDLFEAENYALRIKLSDRKNAASAFVRFDGLLYELGLGRHPKQVLSIKIELDRNPPAGASFATTVVRRYVTLNLLHHDRASLLAGKLHALLARPYVKGRDLYDLLWYLADRSWPAPNLNFLNAALAQTGWKDPALTLENWRSVLLDRLNRIPWEKAREDVLPFLERESEIHLISRENALNLLKTK
jgi:predicted nucleotidyltransferase component of viral defense system